MIQSNKHRRIDTSSGTLTKVNRVTCSPNLSGGNGYGENGNRWC